MGKYLDATGLSHFISKIKTTFQEKLVSGTNIKTINNTSLLGNGNISLPTASDIPTVDTSLDAESDNPIANSAVENALTDGTKIIEVKGFKTDASGYSHAKSWLQVHNTGDIANYAGVWVNSSGWLYSRPKASFVSDIAADITPASIGAQPTLTSGTNIKTINDESILGSGNIAISSGSTVSVTRSLTSGTKSATITVNGTGYDLYAPTPPTASTTTPSMDGTASYGSGTSYARANHVHPTDTSRAASDHTHGNITNGGDITAIAPTVASGDKIIINDESASKITNGPSFGTSTTTYLRNDGTWGTPVGTANQNAFSNVKVGSTTVEANTTTATLELAAGSNITLTPDATNDKVTIAATDTTYESKTAANGGTAVSLVTTGEKYTWNNKASTASPAFSGTPTAPTATSGTNTTQIATTAFVTSAINGLPTPMQFIGTVGTNGTITWVNLAAASSNNEGYTYKVITDHSAETGKPAAKTGDTIISNGSEWIVIPSGDEPSGTVTSITLKAGNGISLDIDNTAITSSGSRTISHADTSSQSSSSNSGRTYIQSITLDDYGHVTGLSTATETVTNTDTKLEVAAITSGTTYYPLVGTGTTAATRQYDTTGLVYVGTNGTANGTNGNSLLTLGNSTASTTTNWKKGTVRLYGTTVYYSDIISGAPTGNRTITLPDKTGTVALTSDIPDVSSFITDAGVTKITTTAGTHTAITNSTGAVSFNVPTKTSHLTNDSGFVTTDTKNTAGSTNNPATLYLIGATTQAANPQTYSHSSIYGVNGVLYAAALNEVMLYVSSSTHNIIIDNNNNASLTIPSGANYVLGGACEKGVDTSISTGSTSTNLPTTAAVVNYIAGMTTDVSMEDTDVDDAVNAAWNGINISAANGVSF